MSAESVTTMGPLLKTLYPDGEPSSIAQEGGAFYAMVRKTNNFYGKAKSVPVAISDTAGRSRDYTFATTNEGEATQVEFTVTRKKFYVTASIENELIEAAEHDSGAVVDAVKWVFDSGFRGFGQAFSTALWGDGSGKLSTIHTTTNLATTTLKLASDDDICKFWIGQKIVFAANVTSALRTATALEVVGIDEDLFTLTLSATPAATSTAIATGDAIFTEGDYQSASNAEMVCGWQKWNPASAPTDTLFGVARTNYPVALGGHRMSGTGKQADEAILDLVIRMSRSGAKVDAGFVNYADFGALQKILMGRYITTTTTVGKWAFKALELDGARGPVRIYPDYGVPSGYCYCCDMRAWELASLNECPHILGLSHDGKRLEWIPTADAKRIRIGTYSNLICHRPKHIGHTTISIS